MVGGESLCPEQSMSFFAVAEQYDEIILDRRAGTQCAGSFENDDETGAVVGCTGPFRDGIVMSYEHNRAAVGCAAECSDDIVNESRVNVASVVDAADTLLDVCFASEFSQLSDQKIADAHGLIAANRMRLLCDLGEMRLCSSSGKDV